VSWEWDVPDGFQMISLASERPPRLVVTVEALEPLMLASELSS